MNFNNSDVKGKALKGGMWLFAFQGFEKGLGFIRLLVLARFLSPNDFGLMGIAMLTIDIVNTFSEAGLIHALIQKKDDIKPYLNSVWTFLLLRGLVLFLLTLVAAPWIATFFNNSQAVPILASMSVIFILQSLKNIGIVYFQKNLEFDKHVYLFGTGAVVDFLFTVGLSILFHNAWALVGGSIAANIALIFVSYHLSTYRPRLDFGFGKIRELLSYGKWVFGSSVMQFLYSNGDDILVGRILGTTSLGYYQLAYKISNLPTTEISRVISLVMFPTYAAYQDSVDHLRRGYMQVMQITMFFSVLIGGGIWIFGEPFVRLFIGEEWLPMVPALKVLVLWGVLRSFGSTVGPIFQANGKPNILTKYQTIQAILMLIIIFPLTNNLNLVGTSVSVVFSALVPAVMSFISVSKLLKLSKKVLIKEVFLPILSAIISIILIRYLTVDSIFKFLIISSFYCLLYFLLSIGLSFYLRSTTHLTINKYFIYFRKLMPVLNK